MKKYNTSSLPYIAAAAQAVQFTHAGFVLLGWWGIPIGALIGTVVSFSVASAASRVSDVAKSRRALSWGGLVILLIISPAAIAPAAYIEFSEVVIDWLRWVTAATWALAPDAAILLSGAIAGKRMVTDGEVAATPAATETKPRKVARKLHYNRIDVAKLTTELQRNPPPTDAQLAQLFRVSHTAIGNARRKIGTLPGMETK